MQPEPTEGVPAAPTAPAADGGPPPGCAGQGSPIVMLAVMFAVLYFMIIRPQQKRQREVDDMLKALRKGDKVRTSGGIRGEIVDLSDTDVTLLIADKVKINVLRSHIASRLDKSAPQAKATGG